MDVISHYLDAGFEWIVWTDIDILFVNFKESFIGKWLDKAGPEHHVALVSECIAESPALFSTVRSGFLAFRNTPKSRAFLAYWKNSHELFQNNANPDQEGLEFMVTQYPWKSMVYIAPPDGIHTYSDCT